VYIHITTKHQNTPPPTKKKKTHTHANQIFSFTSLTQLCKQQEINMKNIIEKQNTTLLLVGRGRDLWMSFFWARRHSRMHSLQKTWPLRQHKGSMRGFRQRQHASKGLIESLPSLSLCVPYPSFFFSSYVKNARSLLFFECLCGIFTSLSLTQRQNPKIGEDERTLN